MHFVEVRSLYWVSIPRVVWFLAECACSASTSVFCVVGAPCPWASAHRLCGSFLLFRVFRSRVFFGSVPGRLGCQRLFAVRPCRRLLLLLFYLCVPPPLLDLVNTISYVQSHQQIKFPSSKQNLKCVVWQWIERQPVLLSSSSSFFFFDVCPFSSFMYERLHVPWTSHLSLLLQYLYLCL